MMQKIIEWVEKNIQPAAGKIANQKHLKALTNTFMSLIPFMTIGSFALIIISPVMESASMNPGFFKSFIQGWEALAGMTGPIFGFIYLICMGMLALYVSIGLSYFLCKTYEMNSFFPMLVTFGAVLIGLTTNAEPVIDASFFGAEGMFPAIVLTIAAFELYRYLTEKKVGYIDLASLGVPTAIAESIGNLVPSLIVLLVFGIVSGGLLLTTGLRIPQLISTLFTPITGLLNSLPGILVIQVLIQLFWWFGIHDSVITGPLTPFVYQFMAANAAAHSAGQALPYIYTSPFAFAFVNSAMNITLAVHCLRSKSKQMNTIGKLGIVPSLFNVSEPLLFGLPIVYNGILLLPFILVPTFNALATYLVMSLGIVNRTFLDPSWNMPGFISSFLSTMDIKAVLFWVFEFAVDFMIWMPFIKVLEKNQLEQEAAD